MRSLAVAAGLLSACLVLPAGPVSAEPTFEGSEPFLSVDPEQTVSNPGTAHVWGSCPGGFRVELRAAPGDRRPQPNTYPDQLLVSLTSSSGPQGSQLLSVTPDPERGLGNFEGDVELPVALPPDSYTFTVALQPDDAADPAYGAWACADTATLTVPSVLTLSSDQALAGGEIRAAGTCPIRQGQVQLFLGSQVLTTAAVDPTTGAFGPLSLTVPAETGAGLVRLDSSCKASADLEVVAGPVPPSPVTQSPVTPSPVTPSPVTESPVTPSPVTPSPVTPSPPDELVVVPNLLGLTQGEARSKIGEDLVLDVSGSGDEVASQEPNAGVQVPPGTTVSVTLGGGPIIPRAITAVVPAWSLVLAVVLGIAALVRPSVARAVRVRRERRWVRRAVFRARPGGWRVSDAPSEPSPGLSVTFQVELNPDRLNFEEVGGVRT
jgi:hypothetical protein